MKPFKVLIVDDDKVVREALKTFAETAEFEAVIAGNANEALEEVRRNKFDLFVVDIGLPGKNGIELISDLRNKLNIHKPVIIVTGYGTGKNFIEASDLGVRYFLSKPFLSSSFVTSLKRAIVSGMEKNLYIKKDKEEDVQKYLMPIKIRRGGAYIEFASFRHPLETDERQRQVVCITCQVGCSSGCKFCRSGCVYKSEVKNISLKDMQSQAVIAETFHGFEENPIQVYFGGSGEPTLNNDVAELIESSSDKYTFRISTVGIKKPLKNFIERLGNNKKLVQLQISLHFPDDELRGRHIKIAKYNPIKDILKLAEKFAEKNGTLVCLNYVLFEGINDSATRIRELASLAKNKPFFVRLSEANKFKIYRPVDVKKLNMAKSILQEDGISFKEFHSRGTSINAGCGQLVAMVNRYYKS